MSCVNVKSSPSDYIGKYECKAPTAATTTTAAAAASKSTAAKGGYPRIDTLLVSGLVCLGVMTLLGA